MAWFVGGQLVLAAAVVPALRHSEDRGPLRAAARRFGWGTLGALGVLLATGAAMATEDDRWDNRTLQVKLGLVAVAAVLVVAHLRRPQQHAFEAAIFAVSLAIVALGVALAE